MKRIYFLCFALTTAITAAVAQSNPQPPPELDAVVKNVLTTFEVPGISIAIVKDGKLVLAKGYGLRQLGQPTPVDEHTLFPIASNTKAFTATALAILVQEGKMKWDDPVIDHLPWFRMSDPFVTANMTIRDLLVHRSGLPAYAGDLLQFPPTNYSREEIVRKLKDIPLAASFRSTYAYDNILYLAAGEVIKAITGQSWEDFVQQRILDKAGMRESVLRFSRLQQQPNLATSHAPVNGKVQVLENFFEQGFSDVSAPAGGIASSASDMAKWMQVHLDSGRAANGSQIFKPSATLELWKLVTPMPFGKAHDAVKPANMDFLGYALGFNVYNYRGVKVVAHGGKLDGFVSRMTLIPDLNLGIAVLTNQEGGGPYASITNAIVDHYLRAPAFDWVAGYKKIAVANREAILKKEKEQAQIRNTTSSPSLPLSAYAGTYEDKWYGQVTISSNNNKLSIRFDHSPQLVGELEHWQYNSFIARWKNRGLRADAYITFSLRADGSIEHATMKAVSALTDPSHNFHDLLLKRKAPEQQPVKIVSKNISGAFPLAAGNQVAPVFFDPREAKVISIASQAFADDIHRVTGYRPAIRNDHEPVAKNAVIVGTIGQSALIDKLMADKKIAVDKIQGKWETFLITVVDRPFPGMDQALVVAGSDRRGTAFGLFELSGMMGVSPLYWWADVHPEKKQALYVTKGSSLIGPPSVKYRGIFINDEMWGLAKWSAKHLDKAVKTIGPKTYEKVFELLLRLKANYIWPAMFYETKPFYYFPENPATANDYAIVVGSSHCEQMLRNNISEWDVFFEQEYKEKKGAWRYDLNKAQIHRYWNDRVQQSRNFESTYMIGMRGVGDSDMPGSASKEEKIVLWNDIVKDQRAMLEKHTGKAASDVPQLFCPYNEVLDWYRTGKMEIPEDISMLWVDDNHGYVRQLPTSKEQQRSGGHGMYYHFSYLGPPESFIWLSTVAPALTSYEMTKSYAYGADKLWIFNVGDIKPAEMEIELAMEMAWDINRWTPEKAYLFPRYWAAKTFGETWADEIGQIKHEFYLLANSGKPEYMYKTQVTTKEAENKIRRYEALAKATIGIGKKIPSRLKDAWYQLVEYPVLGSYYMNQKSWYARKSVLLAKNGDQTSLLYASKAKKAHEEINRLTNKYNKEIAGGKWDGMMVEQIKARWFNMSMPPVATDSSLAAARKQAPVAVPAEPEPNLIKASSFFTKKETPGYTLASFKGLGISGEGIGIMPFTAASFRDSSVQGAPYLEYKTRLVPGNSTIMAKFLPTHAINNNHGLRYAISVNGSTAQIINIEGADQWRKGWSTNVLRGYNAGETKHSINTPGESIIRIYLLDPGLVLDEIAIY